MTTPTQTLTTSARKCFARCPREYKHRYVDLYRPVTTAHALNFGSLIHEALERWMLDSTVSVRMQTAVNECSKDPDTDPYDIVSAEELIRGYHFRWCDEYIKVISVEQTFTAPLINPETDAASRTYSISGKTDAIVEKDGQQWIMEHKTSGSDITPGSMYWQKLRLDTQISTYFLGARSLGYDPVGCIYDVIAKPLIKPAKATPPEKRRLKKDGTPYANIRLEDEKPEVYRLRLRDHITTYPDRYYQRGEVYRLKEEEIDAAYDMWQAAKIIRGNQLANRWPRNTDACFQWQRACDFWPVCTGECGLDNPRYRVAESAHEELTTPTTEDGNESTKQ